MTKILLIDGSNYLFRAYHALPPLTTSKGEPTGALKGFRAMLQNVYRKANPDYVACVFDAHGKTFRHEIYPEYKANRPPMPEDLRVQIEPIHELVRLLGWPLLEIEGVEADDVLATLAKKAAAEGIEAYIATGDKDLAQTVNENVKLVNTMTHEILDREGVHAKYGVYPERIIDYLTLMGDKVDNVPGVPKCGPKTAVKWLEEFGSLEGVIAGAASVPGKIGENLRGALGSLDLSRRLVTINSDVALGIDPKELLLKEPDKEKLQAFYARWEMRQAMGKGKGATDKKEETGRLTHTLSKAKSPAEPIQGDLFAEFALTPESPSVSAVSSPNVTSKDGIEIIDTKEAAESLYARLQEVKESPVAIALLTDSVAPMLDKPAAIALALTPLEIYVIPLALFGVKTLTSETLKTTLSAWFSGSTTKVLHDAKYAKHVFANIGIDLAGSLDDTMLMSYVLEAHLKHDFVSVVKHHLATDVPDEESLLGKGASRSKTDRIDGSSALTWVASRAAALKALGSVLTEKLASDSELHSIYRDIERPICEILFKMERFGVSIDCEELNRQSADLEQRICETEKKIQELAGEPFNPASPKQLAHILFEKLGLPVLKKTAAGTPSTAEEVLSELALDYPLPKAILDYRKFAKLKSTYTDKLPHMVDLRDNRIHTTFGQATAVTGRLASSDPNLQNIPVRTPEGRRVREAFVARSGCKIISADYSQIELRIMAHLSQDKGLIRSFSRGEDVHRATAAEVFGKSPEAVTDNDRRMAKVINFGLIYGMSAFGLAKNLGIDRTSAKRYMEEYFARYPGVADYMERTREEAKKNGFVKTDFGRKLWLPELKSSSAALRAATERAAINAPVQGTAADVIKKAMIAVDAWISEKHLNSRIVLQVHDELVLEVPEEEVNLVKEALPQLMADAAHFEVPLLTGIGVADNWEAAH